MIDFDWYQWIVLPLFIFLARIGDVSLQTLRVLLVMNGRKLLAPVLGAVEVTIWLIAIGQIMQNLNNPVCYLGYAAGFAMGTYVGMRIEEKLAFGNYVIRVITSEATEMIAYLRKLNYSVTSIEAEGNDGHVNVIFLIIRRKDFQTVVEIIKRLNPQAVYTVASVKFVNNKWFAAQNASGSKGTPRGFLDSIFKKSK